MKNNYCHYCQQRVFNDEKFCSQCGAPVKIENKVDTTRMNTPRVLNEFITRFNENLLGYKARLIDSSHTLQDIVIYNKTFFFKQDVAIIATYTDQIHVTWHTNINYYVVRRLIDDAIFDSKLVEGVAK
jgi:hypothetical protein